MRFIRITHGECPKYREKGCGPSLISLTVLRLIFAVTFGDREDRDVSSTARMLSRAAAEDVIGRRRRTKRKPWIRKHFHEREKMQEMSGMSIKYPSAVRQTPDPDLSSEFTVFTRASPTKYCRLCEFRMIFGRLPVVKMHPPKRLHVFIVDES